MRVLHISATPRIEASNTYPIAEAFIGSLQSTVESVEVDTIDVFNHDLPSIAGENIENKYNLMQGQPPEGDAAIAWQEIESLVTHFVAADLYVVTTPMWNFSIPYALKYYIDAIVQPGYTFTYTDQGQPVGLVLGKKMVCITSRGGDYSPGTPFHPYDFQEPYLRTIFGFIGITDIEFINAQPMSITAELRDQAIASATESARSLAAHTRWVDDDADAATGEPGPKDLKPKPLTG
ncbi:MAG: NAD(P)H-dependent oxidoreductase [Actinomycetota bacterium]